jgi:D-alanine-D-alanine ligase
LVEEFIDGAELTVGVLGNDPPAALPILEIDFSSCARSGEFFYSWRMKEYQGDDARGLAPTFHCPARLESSITRRIQALAIRAHHALGCREFSRTDIRLRPDGVPFALEVNPLPGLDPSESNFPIMTAAAGMSYPALINRLVEMAVVRSRGSTRLQEPPIHLVGAAMLARPAGPLLASPAAP